jgi:hypothetical protein
MVEAVAIVFVAAVSLGIYIFAWIGARDFSKRNLSEELAQLQQHREALRENALRGEQQQWDSEMMRQVADRLNDVDHRIALKTLEVQNRGAS